MSEKDFDIEDIFEENGEEIPFTDKRRFDDGGERTNVEVSDESEVNKAAEKVTPEEVKSPKVVKLENALKEVTVRCKAAETKLQSVQRRFEEEKANLENETAERRSRMKKSLEQRAEQGRIDFLNALLPVLDNLNLAIEASEKDSSFEHLLDGVKGTARSFTQALTNVGVKFVESVGESFDPELHEAVDIVEASEENDGKIIAEYARGYTFNDRLLRPARVQVGKASEKQTAGE